MTTLQIVLLLSASIGFYLNYVSKRSCGRRKEAYKGGDYRGIYPEYGMYALYHHMYGNNDGGNDGGSE